MAERSDAWQRFTLHRPMSGTVAEGEQKTIARCVLRVQRWSPSNERDPRFLWTLLERKGLAELAEITNGLAKDRGAAKRAVGVAFRRVGWVCA